MTTPGHRLSSLRADTGLHTRVGVAIFLLIPVCIVVGLELSASLASGASFEASGVVSHTVYGEAGNILQQKRRNFTSLVGSNAWWIRTEVVDVPRQAETNDLSSRGFIVPAHKALYAGPDGMELSAECSCDGSSVYAKREFIKDESEIRLRRETDPKYVGSADKIDIYARNFPSFNGQLVFPVWLALCSHSLFRSKETPCPPMLWMNFAPLEQSGEQYRVQSRSRGNGTVTFLESAAFLNLGYWLSQSGGGKTTIIKLAPGTEPFLEAEYQVLEWNNQDGVPYPKSSQLEIYPIGTRIDQPRHVVMRETVTVNQFRSSARLVSGLPIITNLVKVTDFRSLSGANPLIYFATNRIADLSGASVRRLTAKIEQAARNKTTFENKGLVVRIGTLGVLFGGVAAFLFYMLRNPKHRNKN